MPYARVFSPETARRCDCPRNSDSRLIGLRSTVAVTNSDARGPDQRNRDL